MVIAWTALQGQTLINLLSRQFCANCITFSQYDRYFLKVFDMAIKMSYVVAMCRRGVLNSKSKSLFAIWPLTYYTPVLANWILRNKKNLDFAK